MQKQTETVSLTLRQIQKTITWGIVDGFFIIVIFLLLGAGAQWVFNGVTGEGRDDSDKSSWNHSGVDVITDAKTGLEYLSHGSALTPRLDADGNQIREKIQ